MRFADIAGNESVKRALVTMADTGRVAHAMLLFENDGCGAFALAQAYYQYLSCPNKQDGDSCGVCPSCKRISKLIHPDMHFAFPVNTGSKSGSIAAKDLTSDVYMGEFRALAQDNPYFLERDLSEAMDIESKQAAIGVAQARKISEELSLTAVEDGYKVVFFLQPEKMNPAAANKLLKIVEEPPEKTLFLFITHNPDKVMQTIFSRCQSLRVAPLSKEEVSGELQRRFSFLSDEAESVAGICGGSLGEALDMMRESEDRQTYLDLFQRLLSAVANRDLAACLDCADAVAELSSREKQKAFCKFVSEGIRKIFLQQKGLQNIAYMSTKEAEYIANISLRLPASFCSKALAIVDKAVALLERNVNQKILFCDFVDRLFVSIT